MANVVYPPLPPLKDEDGKWKGPKTKTYGPTLMDLWEQANEIVQQFAKIREAKAQREGLLETSDHPDAVAYRQVKIKATDAIERIKADAKYDDLKAQIKALQEEISKDQKSRIDTAREAEKRARTRAEVSVIGEVLTDIDPTQLSSELQELNDNLSAGKQIIVSEVPEIGKWRPMGTSSASGSNATGDGYKPRLSMAVVNNITVEGSGKSGFPSFSDVAKHVRGANAGDLGKYFLNTVLAGTKEALSSETPHEYTQVVNGVTHTFSILGRKADDTDSTATASHTGTDVSSDDNEEEVAVSVESSDNEEAVA